MFPSIPSDTPPQKQCTKCKAWYPATPEFFSRDKQRSDGLYPQCKSCRKAHYYDPATHDEMLKGKKAYRDRPNIQAQRREWAKRYLCRPEIQAERRAYMDVYIHRPEMKGQFRKYRQTQMSKPGAKERQSAYYKTFYSIPENRQKWQEYLQEYWQRPGNRERHHGTTKAYYDAHKHLPGFRDRARVAYRNRHARKQMVLGSHTPMQIQEQLKRQRFRCYYAACGYAKFARVNGKYVYHVEHTYPLAQAIGTDIRANDISFIVLACPSCNLKKNARRPDQWPEGGRLL